ncbi:hypothetical protein MPSEU_000882300 [Mayamaea pseudoterrestris]|nr:hypothetical protein MPSEU_000882300 [Mayamaea pseudoterrestris]
MKLRDIMRSFGGIVRPLAATRSQSTSTRLFADRKAEVSSSYEVDSDEDAEQRLDGEDSGSATDHHHEQLPTLEQVQQSTCGSSTNRFTSVLQQVGLDLSHFTHVSQLPLKRPITPYDIFCNREIKMSGILAIGFDMDYTLAQYQQPAFDRLAFDGAKRKLVESLGYPKAVLDFEYDHTHWTRGLIIDTQRGNFLKIDRHRYVRVAFHGRRKISSTTRKLLYSRTFNKVISFTEKHFVACDTLFQFVDCDLYSKLIELRDDGESEFMDLKTYEDLYRDVRECVDLCHRDGVIKDEVARDPEKYIVLDKGMVPTLKRYREDGVKVFLLTNSLWEYTSTAMNYLYHGKLVDDETQKRNEWLELFDICIVGSCKPAFMLDPYLNLFRVQPEDGTLRNTDGTYEIAAYGKDGAGKFLAQGKVFQGGNWKHLHALLETEAGEEIMYVGDHLYSDVLRSKRTLGWRSVFIMPELEDEMRTFREQQPLLRQVTALRQLREELCVYGDAIRRSVDVSEEDKTIALAGIFEEDGLIKQKLSHLAEEWHKEFHLSWGAMFNAGYQDSRFAFYVQNYACLYTSRASNLGLVSSERAFRTGLERLPHDKLLDEVDTELVDMDPWET